MTVVKRLDDLCPKYPVQCVTALRLSASKTMPADFLRARSKVTVPMAQWRRNGWWKNSSGKVSLVSDSF